jgi:Ca2+-binding RTX toxin-like protein
MTTTTTIQAPAALAPKALRQVAGGNTRDVNGTPGTDFIITGSGNEKVFAGEGHDLVFTGGGNDEVQAGGGHDLVFGGDGNDKLFGEAGHDFLIGGNGADEMHGGEGNDIMAGGIDHVQDKAFGGAGDDVYVWGRGDGNDEFHGGTGTDALWLRDVDWAALQGALRVYDGSLQMRYDAGTGVVTFVNGNGQPTTFSGELNINGEQMKFFEVERLVLAR